MAQEKPWRPADYPPQAVYLPPQTAENWAFAAGYDRSSAERAGAVLGKRQQSRTGPNYTAWKFVAWALTCGLVVVVVAMFLLHWL
jgi:hypothetical protein